MTMLVTPIRTAGHTQVNRECATRHLVVHDASSVWDGPVLAPAPNDLRGYAMYQGLTDDKLRNL